MGTGCSEVKNYTGSETEGDVMTFVT